jgi:purine-binding chemotaxis protein CheW
MARRPDRVRGPIDWSALRERLESAAHGDSGDGTVSAERERAILETRARQLARPVDKPRALDGLELITFALGDETYAIETRFVMAAFRLTQLSPLPGAKAPIFGVSAWRGDLLTILDLRPLLGVSATALNDLARVLVLGDERATCGVLADAVRDLTTLPISEIAEPPHGVAGNRALLRGMTRDAMLVLDGSALLDLYAGRL